MKMLPFLFFNRPAPEVAKELLGCKLVRRDGRKAEHFMITEVEAYEGFTDKASHASRGKTKRNEIMFRTAGHIYVYFTYGIHWLLNIVTGPKDYPAAVLIRGLKSLSKENLILNGPARLTKKLNITGNLNGKKLGKNSGLWIESSDQKIPVSRIKRSPRIGVDYAGPIWSKKKWRFVLK